MQVRGTSIDRFICPCQCERPFTCNDHAVVRTLGKMHGPRLSGWCAFAGKGLKNTNRVQEATNHKKTEETVGTIIEAVYYKQPNKSYWP